MIKIPLSHMELGDFFFFPSRSAFSPASVQSWRIENAASPLRPLRGTNVPRKILPFRRLLDGIFLATTCFNFAPA